MIFIGLHFFFHTKIKEMFETVYPSALAPENCLMFKYLEDEPHWRMKLLQSMPNDGAN